MEQKKSQNPSNQILLSVNDGFEYRTPVLLSKALKIIENLPSSMVLKENYAMFENQEKERIRFNRIFNNKWTISIFPTINEKNSLSIEYKYLSTNIVSVIIINFFLGSFIGKSLKSLNDVAQYQKLRSNIDEISAQFSNWLICRYCGNHIKKLTNFSCDYCKEDFDVNDFYMVF